MIHSKSPESPLNIHIFQIYCKSYRIQIPETVSYNPDWFLPIESPNPKFHPKFKIYIKKTIPKTQNLLKLNRTYDISILS